MQYCSSETVHLIVPNAAPPAGSLALPTGRNTASRSRGPYTARGAFIGLPLTETGLPRPGLGLI